MFTTEYNGINSFLVGASRLIKDNGVERKVRNQTCWELPEPIMIKITNPLSRWVTIPVRNWDMFIPYAESLWLSSGRNDLKFIEFYVNRMSEFSDDGVYLRGGYGPRLRRFNGNAIDYKIPLNNDNHNIVFKETDQIKHIVDCFNKDLYTRKAIITLSDPTKDFFDESDKFKITKDRPCTQTLHFIKSVDTGKLNLIVNMRSNDLIWGASAVNIFNFTFLQECIAQIIGLEVGAYFHIVDNLHYYERHKNMIERLSRVDEVNDKFYRYEKKFNTLEEYDSQIAKLLEYERDVRLKKISNIINFNDDFFNDWAKVFYLKSYKTHVDFVNPILSELSEKYLN